MRARLWTLPLVVLLGFALAPLQSHLPLDPDEPIAADGSLSAGRARTIFDIEPVLGAFDPPRPPDDPDDPWTFAARLDLEQHWMDQSRDAIARVLGPIDWSLCDVANRERVLAGLKTYYDARGRQKHSFAMRGPNARAFIEQVWSTSVDQRIDEFARDAVKSGFLQARDLPPRSYPEFAKVIAGTAVLGKTCPSSNTGRL